MTQCTSCGVELTPEFPNDENTTTYQFNNALWIGFHGGYGMFVDNLGHNGVLGETDYEAVICHDCAHKLCEQVPWIDKLIQPFHSHSHKKSFWEKHPEHEGWDKE